MLNEKPETRNSKLAKRSDADYEIDAVSKARRIVECLVEEQPVTEAKIAAKTGLGKNLVMRTLKTYRLGGWAIRDEQTLKWSAGPRLVRLAHDI
jgi:DNA-binding IclR family transcriptional regulator